jgi:hypothetical protein
MKILQYHNAPKSLLAISCSPRGHGRHIKTVWRDCKSADDLIWLAQFSTFCSHKDIIAALVQCAKQTQPMLSKLSREACLKAIYVTELWLKDEATDQVVASESKLAGKAANADWDIAENDEQTEQYIYDADDYAKAYASIAHASISQAAIAPTSQLSDSNNRLDNIQIAIADCICCQEYSGIDLHLDRVIKQSIQTRKIRASQQQRDNCGNAHKKDRQPTKWFEASQ